MQPGLELNPLSKHGKWRGIITKQTRLSENTPLCDGMCGAEEIAVKAGAAVGSCPTGSLLIFKRYI
ncbi:MAG: hypothetical protein ACR2GN_06590 [Bacteroidia bacterium]